MELQTTGWNLAMRTVTLGSAEEKRKYFRLLRYLLSEELKTDYEKELEKPLPPRMADLLSRIDSQEVPDVC